MTTQLFITAVGQDRPGVVAGITGALAGLDANLEDTSMTILGGRFAMVLVVSVGGDVEPDQVAAALAEPATRLHLEVSVHAAGPIADDADEIGEPWTVAIHGADHPGIVHGVAQALADLGVNIVDLRTRVVGSDDRPAYAMVLDVVVPPSVTPDQLVADVHAAAAALRVECSLHPSDADIL